MNLFFNFFSTFLLTFSGRLAIIFLTVMFLAVGLPQRAAAGERKVHKMKGLGYFEKLSLAARWFLPRGEAQEAVSDYQELMVDMGEKTFADKFGGPVKAVMLLADKKKIWLWHGAFLFILLFGLFLPAGRVLSRYPESDSYLFIPFLFGAGLAAWLGCGWILKKNLSGWELVIFSILLAAAAFFAGYGLNYLVCRCFPEYSIDAREALPVAAVFALLWFGFKKEERKRPQLWAIAGVLLFLLGLMLVLLYSCWLKYQFIYVEMGMLDGKARWYLLAPRFVLVLLCAVAFLSLVMARVFDRRWRAVFVFALACAVAAVEVWQMTMVIQKDLVLEAAMTQLLRCTVIHLGWGAVLAAVGLI